MTGITARVGKRGAGGEGRRVWRAVGPGLITGASFAAPLERECGPRPRWSFAIASEPRRGKVLLELFFLGGSRPMGIPKLGPQTRSRHSAIRLAPKIYYVHPAMVGSWDEWSRLFERSRGMAFDHVLSAPVFAPGEAGNIFLTGDADRAHPAFDQAIGADEVAAALAEEARCHELKLMIDVVIDRVDPDGRLAASRRDLFARWPRGARNADPRSTAVSSRAAYARLDAAADAHALVGFWHDRLQRLLDSGVKGFRFLNPQALTPSLWCALFGVLKSRAPDLLALAWTPGLKWTEIEQLGGAGFDGVFSSVAWWIIARHGSLRNTTSCGALVPCSAAPRRRSTEDSQTASGRTSRPLIDGRCVSQPRLLAAC
jgi:hypothetical protein